MTEGEREREGEKRGVRARLIICPRSPYVELRLPLPMLPMFPICRAKSEAARVGSCQCEPNVCLMSGR